MIVRSIKNRVFILIYICMFFFAFLLGILFQLPVHFSCLCGCIYLLLTPVLIKNYRIQTEKQKSFSEVCSYLRQVNLSFLTTNNILASLKETQGTFLEGNMKRIIESAIYYMENGLDDIRNVEKEALEMIEREYACEKIGDLHEYMIYAQECGGDFSKEFYMLDNANEVWKTAAWNYYKKMLSIRNAFVCFYFALLFLNIFVLRYLSVTFEIHKMKLVQVTNLLEIILFILLFLFLDQKVNGSILHQEEHRHINWFQKKKEVAKAFPKWLFRVLLLAQSESMEGAILNSRVHAPMVIQSELEDFCSGLLDKARERQLYLSFLSEYQIEGIETTMRDLYAISTGCGNSESMSKAIKRSLEMLAASEAESMKRRGELKGIYQFLPIIVTTGGMLIYLVALMIESFLQISYMLQG